MNILCECKVRGDCKRHGVYKTDREIELCKGVNCDTQTHKMYWEAWEEFRMPGQTSRLVNSGSKARVRARTGPSERIPKGGASSFPVFIEDQCTLLPCKPPGTNIELLLNSFGITVIKGCKCKFRASTMDGNGLDWCKENVDTIARWMLAEDSKRGWFSPITIMKIAKWCITNYKSILKESSGIPSKKDIAKVLILEAIRMSEDCIKCIQPSQNTANSYPPINTIDLSKNVIINLMYHVYPISGKGVWEWNVDQILKRIDLFNGRRIVSIAIDNSTDSPDKVKKRFGKAVSEYIVVKNVSKYREVVPFVPVLSVLESLNPNEVTFCGHAKGIRQDIVTWNGHTNPVRNWTEAMYITTLDNWPLISDLLKDKAMAGSFRRFGQFRVKGSKKWHYSGTFYWFRHIDVFSKNWQYVPLRFWGTEAWPGCLFESNDTACIFADKCPVSLFHWKDWNKLYKDKFEIWKQEHIHSVIGS